MAAILSGLSRMVAFASLGSALLNALLLPARLDFPLPIFGDLPVEDRAREYEWEVSIRSRPTSCIVFSSRRSCFDRTSFSTRGLEEHLFVPSFSFSPSFSLRSIFSFLIVSFSGDGVLIKCSLETRILSLVQYFWSPSIAAL